MENKKCLINNLAELMIALAVVASVSSSAQAEFVGKLDLTPDGCEKTKECILGADFGYIDPRGIGWKADKGNVTDGASIPRWGQIFVGVPFDPAALPAAVIHDHYSKSGRPVRGWFETQRMFHEALLEGGVKEPRASLMFSGVLVGSRKWIKRMKGKKCDLGKEGGACVNQTVEKSLEIQDEIYGTEDYKQALSTIYEKIKSGTVGREAVEALVRETLPDDIFLQNPSGEISEGIYPDSYATE